MWPESSCPGGRGHGFPKAGRLLKRRQFLAMSDRSSKPDLKIRAGLFLVIGRANGLERNRLGVTATRKTGPAVTRNLIKRLVRELFRLSGHQWPTGLDYVFIAGPGAGLRSKAELKADLSLAAKKIAARSFSASKDEPASGRANRAEPDRESSPKAGLYGEASPSGDCFSLLLSIPGRLALGLIFIYQRLISPLLPPACRFRPTCSNYAATAVKVHGFWRGSYLTVRRLLKCHPFHPGGYDPVPPRKEKDHSRFYRAVP